MLGRANLVPTMGDAASGTVSVHQHGDRRGHRHCGGVRVSAAAPTWAVAFTPETQAEMLTLAEEGAALLPAVMAYAERCHKLRQGLELNSEAPIGIPDAAFMTPGYEA